MTGVEILAMEEVAIAFGFDWKTFFIFTGLVIVFVTLVVGFATFSDVGGWGFLIGFVTSLFFGSLIGFGIAYDTLPTDYETHYKITIDDSISMNKFNEKYEIIDQEGKIYTVRERE